MEAGFDLFGFTMARSSVIVSKPPVSDITESHKRIAQHGCSGMGYRHSRGRENKTRVKIRENGLITRSRQLSMLQCQLTCTCRSPVPLITQSGD